MVLEHGKREFQKQQDQVILYLQMIILILLLVTLAIAIDGIDDERNILGELCDLELTPNDDNKFVDVPIERNKFCNFNPKSVGKCGDNCNFVYYHN